MRTLIGYSYKILNKDFTNGSCSNVRCYRSLKYTLKLAKQELADYVNKNVEDISLIGCREDECDFIKGDGDDITSWMSYVTENNDHCEEPLAYLVIFDVCLCDDEDD